MERTGTRDLRRAVVTLRRAHGALDRGCACTIRPLLGPELPFLQLLCAALGLPPAPRRPPSKFCSPVLCPSVCHTLFLWGAPPGQAFAPGASGVHLPSASCTRSLVTGFACRTPRPEAPERQGCTQPVGRVLGSAWSRARTVLSGVSGPVTRTLQNTALAPAAGVPPGTGTGSPHAVHWCLRGLDVRLHAVQSRGE